MCDIVRMCNKQFNGHIWLVESEELRSFNQVNAKCRIIKQAKLKGDKKNPEIKHDYTDVICLITAQTSPVCDLHRRAE